MCLFDVLPDSFMNVVYRLFCKIVLIYTCIKTHIYWYIYIGIYIILDYSVWVIKSVSWTYLYITLF